MPKSKRSLNELLRDLRRIEEHRVDLTNEKISKIYKSLMKDLNSFLSDYYVKYADDAGKLTPEILEAQSQKARFLEEITRNTDSITPQVKKEILNLVDKTYANCYTGMLKAVKESVDAEPIKNIKVNEDITKATINNNIDRLTLPTVLERNRQNIIYDIQQTLTIGLINGDTYTHMARRIEERLNVNKSKAMNIVRTESHRNIEGGFLDGAEKIQSKLEDSELIYAVTWYNMGDQRVRPQQRVKTKKGWKTYTSRNGANHIQMEGKTVKAGDLFDLGNGAKAKCPGRSGVASQDCNCRCGLEYNIMTLEEFEKATGKSLTKDIKNDTINESNKGKITKITDNAINNVPYVKINGYTDEQCQFIQKQHKELLKYARDNNNNKEVAFVFSNALKHKEKYKGEEDQLAFGQQLYGTDLFIMHNHPRNSSFSYNDVSEFLGMDTIKTITIVKNNGNIEVIFKNDKFYSEKAMTLLRRLFKKYFKRGTDDEYRKIITTFIKKEDGIEWQE